MPLNTMFWFCLGSKEFTPENCTKHESVSIATGVKQSHAHTGLKSPVPETCTSKVRATILWATWQVFPHVNQFLRSAAQLVKRWAQRVKRWAQRVERWAQRVKRWAQRVERWVQRVKRWAQRPNGCRMGDLAGISPCKSIFTVSWSKDRLSGSKDGFSAMVTIRPLFFWLPDFCVQWTQKFFGVNTKVCVTKNV